MVRHDPMELEHHEPAGTRSDPIGEARHEPNHPREHDPRRRLNEDRSGSEDYNPRCKGSPNEKLELKIQMGINEFASWLGFAVGHVLRSYRRL